MLVPGRESLPTNYYTDWNSFYYDLFTTGVVPGASYDAEFYTMVTNAYDVRGD